MPPPPLTTTPPPCIKLKDRKKKFLLKISVLTMDFISDPGFVPKPFRTRHAQELDERYTQADHQSLWNSQAPLKLH